MSGERRPAPVPPGTDVLALAALAESAAREAGDLLRRGREGDVAVTATKSTTSDVVTALDLASERLIAERLRAARPDDALLGEEGGASAGSSGLTWVVDPLDGTVNYLYGIPTYAVSVAVVAGEPALGRWQPLAGCVHDPASGATWTAAAGGGARLDGVPLTVGAPPAMAGALVATGFGYDPARRAEQGATVAALLPLVRDVRRAGVAALDLCAVAAGRVDAYYERGVKPWDVAAGWLVATEAGVRVQALEHPDGGDRLVVAAADPLADELAGWLAADLAASARAGRPADPAGRPDR